MRKNTLLYNVMTHKVLLKVYKKLLQKVDFNKKSKTL